MGTSSIFVTYGGCLASIGFKENNAEKCKQLPHKIETLMSSPKIKTIVIGQIWGLYKQENPFEFEEGVNKYIELIRTYGNGKNIGISHKMGRRFLRRGTRIFLSSGTTIYGISLIHNQLGLDALVDCF